MKSSCKLIALKLTNAIIKKFKSIRILIQVFREYHQAPLLQYMKPENKIIYYRCEEYGPKLFWCNMIIQVLNICFKFIPSIVNSGEKEYWHKSDY